MSLTRPIPALLLLAAVLPAAEPTAVPTLEERVKALDQQVRLLQRKAEVAEEVAKAADDKLKAAVKPSDLVFKWKAVIQARAVAGASADAANGDGQDYFASTNANGSESESLRLGLRRARLTIEARSKDDWFALATIRADSVGTSGTTSTGAAAVGLYAAYVGKTFKHGDYEHDVKLGVDQFYSNWSTISASTGLFAGDRSVGVITGNSSQREAGLNYQFRSPILRAGFDIQDNSNLTRTATNTPSSGNYDRKPTPFTSLRIEGAPGADYLPARKQESYVGAFGTEVVFGLDYQNSGRTYAVANEERQFHIFGPDLLIHWDNLTFLAEYRLSHLGRSATAGTLANSEAESLDGRHWNAQAGYVLPLEDLPLKIEPALRFAVTDWATDLDERSQWGTNGSRDNNAYNPNTFLAQTKLKKGELEDGTTSLGSGRQVDVGVNLYWNGHANKTQISYQAWKAEEGEGVARAILVQHQVQF